MRKQDRNDDLFGWHERRLVDHLTGGPDQTHANCLFGRPVLEAAFLCSICIKDASNEGGLRF
jgi:hypothetical protein